jgi:hypothetical protein
VHERRKPAGQGCGEDDSSSSKVPKLKLKL